MWLAQYGKTSCQACGNNPSKPMTTLCRKPTTYLLNSSASFLKNLDKGFLCQSCHDDITWLPSPLLIDLSNDSSLSIQSATSYNAIMRKAIIAFKYKADFSALPILVNAIRQLPVPVGCNRSNSMILPMPTTNKRLKDRGFDPVTILCKYLSYHWNIDIFDGIERTDSVTSQQGLSRQERLNNVIDAFEMQKVVSKPNLILFDDVATTGSTLKSLAKCANNANYPLTISAYTIAHGNN